MVKLINWFTGNTMYVAEDRLDEYLAAGHKLASAPVKEKPKEKPKGKTKTTKKK